MKHRLLLFGLLLFSTVCASAQIELGAGKWKTWFIPSGETYSLPAPEVSRKEIADILAAQKNITPDEMQKMLYWNAGAPGFRWYQMASRLMMSDVNGNGVFVNMLVNAAIYDATVAAWNAKYKYKRARPFEADNKVKALLPKPESPSYPCEHSVAAGVAATIIAHYYPDLADSVARMSDQMMRSRVASGLVYPGDTKAGFDLGKKIALAEIELTKDFVTKKQWDGKFPDRQGIWTGKFPVLIMAKYNRTVVLDSASQFRPAPPPDFAKDMEELKSFKQTFRSQANAFHYASQATHDDIISKKIFEYNLHLNPPRAARLHAAVNIAYYDGVIACFEAKYAYWGIRPDQYDPTFKPLIQSPPFPGYPSGHAMMSGIIGEIFPYFFPLEKDVFTKMARDGAESRFHAGIHFRSDNDAGLELGRKVAASVVTRIRQDGADNQAIHSIVKK